MIAKGWVKTPEEIRKIQERLAAPAFMQGKMISVSFLTRPEIVREVLPAIGVAGKSDGHLLPGDGAGERQGKASRELGK